MSREPTVYMPGDLLFSEGDPSGGLYFLQSGKVEIFRTRNETEILLGTLGPGEVIGTLTVFNGEPRTASARALTAVEAQYMSSASLAQGLNKIPVWAVAIIKDTIARLKHVDELLVDVTLRERRLRAEQGTVLHHAAQIAHLCALLGQVGSTPNSGGGFAIKTLASQAEGPLNQKAAYCEAILQILGASKILLPKGDPRLGNTTVGIAPEKLRAFAAFALAITKKGNTEFIPSKYVPLMGHLIRVGSKINTTSGCPRREFLELLSKESGRKYEAALLETLAEFEVIEFKDEKLSYDPEALEERVLFEAACSSLLDADLAPLRQTKPKRPLTSA